MIVTPIKTRKIRPGQIDVFGLLAESITSLEEKTVVAVASKVVSMCEGRIVPIDQADKESLIKQEAEYYMPSRVSKYDHHFTITQNTLIAASGIDESNGGGNYILWPENPQKTANEIRAYLSKKFGVENIGVVITDSTAMPLRWGTIGVMLAHSGFEATNDYVGRRDLFGRPFTVSRAGIGLGLAATANLVMGEGTEQTPIVVTGDVPFIKFQPRNPTRAELKMVNIAKEDDLFEPFLSSVKWRRGGSGK